jgi:hypothetical protein
LRNVGLLLSLIFTLGACGHGLVPDSDEINVYPTNYKSDIVAAMHAYLKNPTGIRDAAISEPTIKSRRRRPLRRMPAIHAKKERQRIWRHKGDRRRVHERAAGSICRFAENRVCRRDLCGIPRATKPAAVTDIKPSSRQFPARAAATPPRAKEMPKER